jgi:hypothetical protein
MPRVSWGGTVTSRRAPGFLKVILGCTDRKWSSHWHHIGVQVNVPHRALQHGPGSLHDVNVPHWATQPGPGPLHDVHVPKWATQHGPGPLHDVQYPTGQLSLALDPYMMSMYLSGQPHWAPQLGPGALQDIHVPHPCNFGGSKIPCIMFPIHATLVGQRSHVWKKLWN